MGGATRHPDRGRLRSGLRGELCIWGAPKKTPVEIIDKLNREINAGLDDPKLKTRLVDLGGTLLAGSPADFGKLMADDTEKWGKVVKFIGIKAD
jgi:tripartite-type tricarboxylate transporter receptor subunit TctC